jgi:hypothetical protein
MISPFSGPYYGLWLGWGSAIAQNVECRLFLLIWSSGTRLDSTIAISFNRLRQARSCDLGPHAKWTVDRPAVLDVGLRLITPSHILGCKAARSCDQTQQVLALSVTRQTRGLG